MKSQSPQTGQFNSYVNDEVKTEKPEWRLNPLKRVNSILTVLKKSGFDRLESLNPLKRVNSILTLMFQIIHMPTLFKSQSPQTGQFNSYRNALFFTLILLLKVSIPSNGSIQFLPKTYT